MEMNTYELWYYIMIASFVVAGVFLAIAIIFFFRAHIPSTIAVLNGKAQKMDIERIRTEIGQDGHERFHYSEEEEEREETRSGATDPGKHAPVAQGHLEPDSLSPDERETEALISEEPRMESLPSDEQPTDMLLPDDPQTDMLLPDDPQTDMLLQDDSRTEVLSPDGQQTDVLLPDEPQTDMLSQADPGASDGTKPFRVVLDETVVHAEDIIGDDESRQKTV
jgi:hypothetical protein